MRNDLRQQKNGGRGTVQTCREVGANQQSCTKRLCRYLWIILTDDLDVSAQETNISSQSVEQRCTRDRVSLTWAETEQVSLLLNVLNVKTRANLDVQLTDVRVGQRLVQGQDVSVR